jgi:hypothetical protein
LNEPFVVSVGDDRILVHAHNRAKTQECRSLQETLNSFESALALSTSVLS